MRHSAGTISEVRESVETNQARLERVSSAAEFEEIAPCGGKVTFGIRTDGGRKSYGVGVSHDRPTPASWFAVYAL